MHVNFRKPPNGCTVASLTMAFLLSSTVASNAHADALSAGSHFWANLARAGMSFSVKPADTVTTATPVRGMYMVAMRSGGLLAYVNESGTIYGDGSGFKVLEPGRERQMTPDEKSLMRLEIMRNLDPEKLIKVVYGNGGGRKLLMTSAVDCGYCKKLEESLAKNAKSLNTTFYVLPSSLQKIDQGGIAKLQAVKNIWCAPNNAEAWKSYWAKGAVPQERTCQITPETAQEQYGAVVTMLAAAGGNMTGVPRIINEDGIPVPINYEMNAAAANAAFGPGFRSLLPTPPAPQWILSENEARAQQQILAAQSPVPQQHQQQQQQPGKINTKDLLKKLFK